MLFVFSIPYLLTIFYLVFVQECFDEMILKFPFPISNPYRYPSLRSSLSDPFWISAFAIGSPPRIITFYRSPWNTLISSWSLVQQSFLPSVKLSLTISREIYLTSYRRFRPNKYDPHLWRRCYRGGWHRSCPPLILQAVFTWQKSIL